MLALIEPFNLLEFEDRPHLGCAMLIAACRKQGMNTTLINGQTRFLKEMFVNNSRELWELIRDFKTKDLKYQKITAFKTIVHKKGFTQFQKEMADLYQDIIIDKNPRQYFNAQAIEKFSGLFRIFSTIYSYYLKELNYKELNIVNHYVKIILNTNFRYAGFSLDSFDLLSRAIRKQVKAQTGLTIIAGGSLTPFLNLQNLNRIFEEEYIDYLIVGAGEEALPALIEKLNNNKQPRNIPNVFYKENGKVRTSNLEVIKNLNLLPYPDFSQFPLDLYLTPKRILPLQTARGCSWRKCAFCQHHNINFGQYITLNEQRVVETIAHLQKNYNCQHFAFHDEELPPIRAKKISQAILDNQLKNIYINIYARLVSGYTDKLLRGMRKAGFTLIHWGLESGCQRILNLMHKGITIATASRILKASSKHKIANLCFIMFGFPGETKEEAEQTVKFLQNHTEAIDDVMVASFNLRTYSPIGKNPKKWGLNVKNDGSYTINDGMSLKEIESFYLRFIRNCKINSPEVNSGKLKYLLPGLNERMMHFLNSSHGLLSAKNALKHCKTHQLNSLYPIILGELKKSGRIKILLPINAGEPVYINRNFPLKKMALDEIEEKVFLLSDGRISISDIISNIPGDLIKKYRIRNLKKKCLEFFKDILAKNLGLVFTKSWN